VPAGTAPPVIERGRPSDGGRCALAHRLAGDRGLLGRRRVGGGCPTHPLLQRDQDERGHDRAGQDRDDEHRHVADGEEDEDAAVRGT